MARVYGAATSDRVTFTQGGGFTGLNNLAAGTGFTGIAVLRQTDTGNNDYIMSKSPSTSAGWEFFSGFNNGGSTPGHLRLIVWSPVTRYDLQAPVGQAVVQNQHECVAFTYDTTQAAASRANFYRGPLETPVTKVTGTVVAISTGSGTPSTDAAASLTGWNNVRGGNTNAFNGDGSWLVLFNRVLNQAEIQTVQAGIVVYQAGLEANDAATKTRGANLITSVSGYVMVNYQAGDGSCTELSGNNITAANTGTITAGTEQTGWFAPSTFSDDMESTLSEQTTYRYTSEFATAAFVTSATGFSAWQRTTLDPATYPNEARVAYEVNGTPTGSLASAALNTGSTTAAYNGNTVSGLSASSKTITFVNGPRSHPNGVPAPYQGTFLLAVRFTAAATQSAVSSPNNRMILLGDSGFANAFSTTFPEQDGCFLQFRRNKPAWLDAVAFYGAGGNALYDHFVDATAQNATAALVALSNTAAVVIALMANDHGRAYWSSASAKTGLVAGINAIHAIRPTIPVYILPMYPSNNESALSATYSETYPTWRSMLATVPAACNVPTKVTVANPMSPVWLNTATGLNADGIHANTSGHASLYTNVVSFFAANPGGGNDPNPTPPSGSNRRRRARRVAGVLL